MGIEQVGQTDIEQVGQTDIEQVGQTDIEQVGTDGYRAGRTDGHRAGRDRRTAEVRAERGVTIRKSTISLPWRCLSVNPQSISKVHFRVESFTLTCYCL